MTLDLAQIVELQRRELEELRVENVRLREELNKALQRIAELEQAGSRQAAPFRRSETDKIPPEERKRPGRKPGHRGAFRQAPREVDEHIEVPLPACPRCGGPLTDRSYLTQTIEEIPPLRPRVIRLVTESGVCACCGVVHSRHSLQTSRAQGAAGTQLGPRALAVAALLNKHLGNTIGNTCRILRRLCGLSITRGGLAQALARVAAKLSGEYDKLLDCLRGSPAVNADETSWWVGGPGWWLWTFTNPQTTVFKVDNSRGSQVVHEVLGTDYAGVLVSDCLSSYDPPPYRKHKCIAHHLKAIQQARDHPGMGPSRYLDDWRLLFQAVLGVTKSRDAMSPEDYAERCRHIEAWCDRLVATPCAQTGELAVRNRLQKQRPHLLGCLYEPAAEPTNNRAERALRPAVIARKLSCGNKTPRGSRAWQILTSLAQTCTQQGQDFIDFVSQRITLEPQLAG